MSRAISKFIARCPGQKCQLCGSDISDRTPGTKYCLECSHAADRLNAEKRKARTKLLEDRDKVMPLIPWKEDDLDFKCQVCGHIDHSPEDRFCYYCGQRLKEETDG